MTSCCGCAKDLKVTVEGTWLQRCLNDLNDELAERGLRIRPHAWISNEWFSPDDTPGIAIPFYLAHPRLMRLERKMIIDVEGGTVPECMRILRHEAGHVLQCPISCSADADGRSCSAGRRPAIPAIIGQTQPAAATSTTCRGGTLKATRTRISPRRSRCGSRRVRTGASAMPAGRL